MIGSREADAAMCSRELSLQVPDAWLEAIPGELSATERRAGYLDFFMRRLAAAHTFEQEAIDARARLV